MLALTGRTIGQMPAPRVNAPTPDDPYPLQAAGWGPEAGHGLFYSRWAEDWTRQRANDTAPPGKAMPIGGDASLTLAAESRLRYDRAVDAQLRPGDDYEQGMFRGIVGADLRLNANIRIYGEVGTGQVEARRSTTSPAFQNDASLQQLFVDTRRQVGSCLVGAMVGRQEFADGPRQLVSLSDGPNLHRTWNGVRLYAHAGRWRLGAFDLRATRLLRDAFDEQIDHAERLSGLNGSVIVATGSEGSTLYLDPFWFRSEDPDLRVGNTTGLDARDTYGARLWGRRGDLRGDWTFARQTGDSVDRDVDAWALFAVQSVGLSRGAWRPRLTVHVDVASGGGTYGTGTVKAFHQLYASSTYLGEGRFLSLSNLLLIAPGIAVAPTPTTSLSVEYGFARRLTGDDAVYAGGMRAYANTERVSGAEIGELLRLTATWSTSPNTDVTFGFEHLAAGDVLERAGLASGCYVYASMTIRY
jgi:hypothetical protein